MWIKKLGWHFISNHSSWQWSRLCTDVICDKQVTFYERIQRKLCYIHSSNNLIIITEKKICRGTCTTHQLQLNLLATTFHSLWAMISLYGFKLVYHLCCILWPNILTLNCSVNWLISSSLRLILCFCSISYWFLGPRPTNNTQKNYSKPQRIQPPVLTIGFDSNWLYWVFQETWWPVVDAWLQKVQIMVLF